MAPSNPSFQAFFVTSGDGQSRRDAAAIVADEPNPTPLVTSHTSLGVSCGLGRVPAAIGLPHGDCISFSSLSVSVCLSSIAYVSYIVIYCMSLVP